MSESRDVARRPRRIRGLLLSVVAGAAVIGGAAMVNKDPSAGPSPVAVIEPAPEAAGTSSGSLGVTVKTGPVVSAQSGIRW